MLKIAAIAISASLISASLVSAVASAEQLPGNPKAGHAFVLDNCSQCHAVGSGGKTSFPKPGPAFRDLANNAATTPLSLRIFLTTNHPTMPNLILSRKELNDVISYILSLRRPAQTHS